MAEQISSLSFTKDWTNPEDFPTVQTDEDQVRADMQVLYNEIKSYINGTLIPVCQNLQDALEDLPEAGLGDMMRNTYDPSRKEEDIFAYTDNKVKLLTGSIVFLTTAPTSDNTDGGYKFVYLNSEPETKYNGYVYLINDD